MKENIEHPSRFPLENSVPDNKEDCQLDHEFALDDESEDEPIEPSLLPGTSEIESGRGRLGSVLSGRCGSSIIPSERRKPRQGSTTSVISFGVVSAIHALSGAERRRSHSNYDTTEARSTLSVMDNTATTRRMSRTTQIMNEEMNVISIPEPTSGFKMGLETVLQTPAKELVEFEVEEVPDHRATGKIASWRGAIILVRLYRFRCAAAV